MLIQVGRNVCVNNNHEKKKHKEKHKKQTNKKNDMVIYVNPSHQ